jgi:hypothetical protein
VFNIWLIDRHAKLQKLTAQGFSPIFAGIFVLNFFLSGIRP